MQVLIGFIIATFIALTGVGAGTITTPLLILFLHVPTPVAVTTGLLFSAAVKLALVPTQIWRKQVSWRVLGMMLLGGLGGVVLGTLTSKYIPKRPLRFALWIWLLIIGVQFLYTNITAPREPSSTIAKRAVPSR